jgi:hypothetical protein
MHTSSDSCGEPLLYTLTHPVRRFDRTPDSPNVAMLEVIGATVVEHLFEIEFGAKNVPSIPLPLARMHKIF